MPAKQFSLAVMICGALDILYAIVSTMLKGGTAAMVLHSVASGPFGERATSWGFGGALLGLLVHFAIMTVMVATYFFLARNTSLGSFSPWVTGTVYGVALYIFMYFVVLPLRWPAVFPQTDPTKIALSLFPHIAFVGIPMALIAARSAQASLAR